MRVIALSMRLAQAWCFGLLIVACGSNPGPEATEQADAADPSLGDGAASCSADSDCPTGEICRNVRVGDVTGYQCIPAQSTLDDDAGADAPGDASEEAVHPADSGSSGCTNQLAVTITRTGPDPTCTFNTTVVSSSPATLAYPCAGGSASVSFGSQTFTGTVTSGTVSLTNVTTYPFSFTVSGKTYTCEYTETQTITGTLASGSLTFNLQQALDASQPLLCSEVTIPCYESGTVSVQ
jgi:Cys-rich repeat protein